jgi:hypothetical protein
VVVVAVVGRTSRPTSRSVRLSTTPDFAIRSVLPRRRRRQYLDSLTAIVKVARSTTS